MICCINKTLLCVIFFLFCVNSFQFSFICKRHISLYPAGVQIIYLTVLEVDEKPTHIHHCTDTEPECTDDRNDRRNQQTYDEEVSAPPGNRPPVENIPDHNDHKGPEETVDYRINKDRSGDNTIPESVFRSNADQFIADGAQWPLGTGLVEIIQIVLAAMKHAVKIERLFAGKFWNHDVQSHRHDKGDKVEFENKGIIVE